jgi:hypothetical protein
LVFTDGAFENGHASIGAVLVDLQSGSRVTWGLSLPQDLVARWVEIVGKQIITQVELLPILMVRLAFNADVCGRRILYFIDNDPARDSLVNGGSRSPLSDLIVDKFYEAEFRFQTLPWFTRVPSHSNPADLPSRGAVQEASRRFGALQVIPPVVPDYLFNPTIHRQVEEDRA